MSTATAPVFLPYTLALQSPVIATALSGDPNSAVTQPFIPGGAIRGAVAARLLASGISGDNVVFRDLVLSGAVRYLHAYPNIQGARALPSPASWRSQKAAPDRARDLLAFSGRVTEGGDVDDLADIWPEESVVSIGGPFVAAFASAGKRDVVTPRMNARHHQQRDRVKGRPWLDDRGGQEVAHGAIFVYEYLEPEQEFGGLIQVMPAATAHIERLEELLMRPILIGRSRRAGYGGDAIVTFAKEATREYDNVSGSLTRNLDEGERFRIMLVSACVSRHPVTGQVDPAGLEQELAARLPVTIERRCWMFETIGSFNRKWRLETPQAIAISAGSVLVLKATEALHLSVLRAVECEGLGDRRVEGFGRVLFMEYSEDTAPISLSRDSMEVVGKPATLKLANIVQDSVRQKIRFVEQRIVLAAARSEVERLAADIGHEVRNIPTGSLLGRIRTLFRSVHDEAAACCALKNHSTWCCRDGDSALKEEARRKLEACTVDVEGDSLLQWLRGLAAAPASDDGWEALVTAAKDVSTLTGLAEKHRLTTSAAAEELLRQHSATLRVHLVDAMLATLARRNRGGLR